MNRRCSDSPERRARALRLRRPELPFEVGVPVAKGVKAVGRVKPGKLEEMRLKKGRVEWPSQG